MATKNKWIESKDMKELSGMIKALGHPSRIAIMFLLCNREDKRMTVKCIYNELKMEQPVISRHLGILKNSGLVRRMVEGADTFYELCEQNKTVEHISKCFSSLKINS